MSSKYPRKKLDFFNGGKGVDLAQYDVQDNSYAQTSENGNNETMEDDSMTQETNRDSMSPSYHYSEASPMCSYSPSSPPYHSQSPTYLHAPIPQYCTNYSTLDSQVHFSPHLLNQGVQIHPFAHPHPLPPAPIPSNPYPGTSSLFAEPNYSGFPNSAAYPPLRPMDPNGMNMGVYDPLHCLDHPSGINTVRDSDATKKKRQQKCSLCSNHGIVIDVKGHKWFCPFRNCECERCTITRGRQHHMKEQQKLTRHLQRLQ